MKKLFILLMLLPFVSFAQSSDATLTTSANTIRNETTPGGNTALRVGNMFNAIISSKFSRVDDAGLASLENLSTTGIIVQTVANTMATRTLQSGNGTTVTNGDGVSGNPSYSIGGTVTNNISLTPDANNAYNLTLGSDDRRLSLVQFFTANEISQDIVLDNSNIYGFVVIPDYQGSGSTYNAAIGVESVSTSLATSSTSEMIGVAVNVGNLSNANFSGTFKGFVTDSRSSQNEFRVSAGTGNYYSFVAEPTYLTSGSYTGIARGFYYNPTLSGTTGLTNIAFENTSGEIRMNTSSGLIELDTVVHLVGRRHSDGALVLKNIYPDILDKVSVSTASGTIDLDTDGKKQRVFTGSSSFATAKNLTISNETSSTAAFVFTFEITNLAAVLTMETNVLMQDSRFDGDDWTATATGVYKMTGTYDGTNWLCEISANPYQ